MKKLSSTVAELEKRAAYKKKLVFNIHNVFLKLYFLCIYLFIYLFIYFYNLSSYQNKRVTVIKLRNENEQNVICYSQLRKLRISFVKKFQTIAIYLFPTLYLTS